MSETSPRLDARVILVAGARAAERRLLSEIELALPPGRVPALPVRVVVPSHSLREHLLARLAERRPAWLALEVASLAALASAILERTGGAPPSGARLESLFAARLAARETALARSLGGLARGFEAVAGAVDDLLGAGFVEAHLEAVEERLTLERERAGRPAVARARAIARVTAGVRRELARRGLVPGVQLYLEAAQRLRSSPERALPAHAVFIHGFADATGVATDLLEALVRHAGARVIVDTPPGPDGAPPAWRFGRRLIERLQGVAPVEAPEPAAPEAFAAPALERFRAVDPAREARGAVAWLAADAATRKRPEAAAVVARDLVPDLGRLASELDRQALPFSAASGLLSPRAAVARGLLTLLERREETPLGVVLGLARERLLEACGVGPAELALACALGGARTLGAAARLERKEQRLPVPDRMAAASGSAPPRVLRRAVPAQAVAAARNLFGALLAELSLLARPQSISEALPRLRRLLAAALPREAAETFGAALADLEAAGDLVIAADELAGLADGAWRELAAEPLGRGAGVAILSVTEARGRTFDRLALIGLTRDRFPRPIRPDPLLPDALRARLRDLLPDLPVKSEGHDEERYLFAQLLAAAERVALFRPLADEDGRPAPPSPLLDELSRALAAQELAAPAPVAPSALDLAVLAALARGEAGLALPFASALEEARWRFGGGQGEPARIAGARLAVLAEHGADPSRPSRPTLGPFLGRVGRPATVDPRQLAPSVTTLERLAGCGWRVFLERFLRLAPLPDLTEALPSLPSRLTGSVVHRVLERVFPARAGGGAAALASSLEAEPVACAWPRPGRLERETLAAARSALAEAGLDVALFEASLLREALALLEVARAADWAAGSRDLLAAEAEGEAVFEVAGAERRISFRVDRVEREGDQAVLTDYKTGRPLSDRLKASTRRAHLLAGIARGELLQLPVYLRSLPGRPSRARYLQLAPELDERAREIALDGGELAGAGHEAALAALFAAWDSGAFVPRLLEWELHQTYSGCAACDVREACVQGDSGARLRLERWARRPAEELRGFEGAARAWWDLRRPKAKAESSE